MPYALPSAIPREEIAYVYPMRYATPCTLNGSSLRWDGMAECVPEASLECHISFIFDLRSSPDSARLRLPQYLCSRRNLLLQSFRRMDGTLEGEKGSRRERERRRSTQTFKFPPAEVNLQVELFSHAGESTQVNESQIWMSSLDAIFYCTGNP